MPEEVQNCIICGRPDNSGLVVRGHAICADCEQRIISVAADDPTYAGMVRKLRQLWQEAEAPGGA